MHALDHRLRVTPNVLRDLTALLDQCDGALGRIADAATCASGSAASHGGDVLRNDARRADEVNPPTSRSVPLHDLFDPIAHRAHRPARSAPTGRLLLARGVLCAAVMANVLLDPTLRRARIVRTTVAVMLVGSAGFAAISAVELRPRDQPALVLQTPRRPSKSSRRQPVCGRCPVTGRAHPHRPTSRRAPEVSAHRRRAFAPPEVTAFVDSSVAGSLESLRRHADQITTAVLSGLDVSERGTIEGRLDPDALQAARDFGVRPMLRLNLDTREGSLKLVGAIDARLAEQLTALCEAQRLAGVHIDLSDAATWRGIASVVREVGRALHAAGLELTVDVPAGLESDGLDELAHVADRILIKTFDALDARPLSGPIAADALVGEALGAATTRLPPARLMAGLAIHGYDQVESQRPHPTSFVEALAAAKEAQAWPGWDASGNVRLSYADEKGHHHVSLADAATIWNQIRIVADNGIEAVALSRLGGEDPGIWIALRGGDPDSFGAVPGDGRVEVTGEGPFVSLALSPEAGQRTFELDADHIADERWLRLPAPYLVRRAGLEPGLVALTFDDGPDPTFTPLILDVLKHEEVPATFFVRGGRAVESPQLVRRVFAEGHELGSRGFTQANVDGMGDLRLRAEVEGTTRVIESLVGRRSLLYRPALLSDIEPRTTAEAASFARLSVLGHIAVDADVDPRDWYASTPEPLAEQTVEEVGHGGVIVLHDGGGDRRTTVQALPLIIRRLRARGLQFVPLSRLIGKSRDDVMPASPSPPTIGEEIAQGSVAAGARLAQGSRLALWITLSLMLLRAVIMPLGAIVAACRRKKPAVVRPLPSVTAVVPIHNEEPLIGDTVDALLASDIPFDVVVVDDGSTDGTVEMISRRYRRESRVRLIRQARAGKAAALQSGFRVSRTEVVVTLGADTMVGPDTVRRLIEPLRDPSIGAVAGTTDVGRLSSPVERWQAIESLARQEVDLRAWSALRTLPVVPTALGAWRRSAVAEAGGFRPDTMSPDADLTMMLCRRGWRMIHAHRARARTGVPASFDTLPQHCLRDRFGMLQALWRHRGAVLKRSERSFGRIVWPLLLVSGVLMPLMSLPALLGLAFAGLCGSLQPLLAMIAAVLLAEIMRLAVAMRLAPVGRRPDLWTCARSAISTWLIYRGLLLVAAWRSMARAIDGAPMDPNSHQREKTTLAFVAMRRALQRVNEQARQARASAR
jgi:cellulose synthase/poly-beta-1,6-N-acetylglucosamine synthase-like glycosyltransferase/peptidoglycan/xylan/chitin deacetylase (PgdA/CDA1 family)